MYTIHYTYIQVSIIIYIISNLYKIDLLYLKGGAVEVIRHLPDEQRNAERALVTCSKM